jgi:hypothetical protein
MDTQRPLALVTGASSGIGEALARRIARDGFDLLLVARRQERLDALAADLPVTAHTAAIDLAAPDAGEALEEEVLRIGRPVTVLVNNAGFGDTSPFHAAPPDRLMGMVDLNVRAVVDLARRFLPGMRERDRGGIINVASTAAFQPGPGMAVYYATKAFVLSFSEALWEEARGTGVTVSALCPGPTASEFGEISGLEDRLLFRIARPMPAKDVADIGWRGFLAGRRVVVTGWQNKVTAAGTKFVPRRVLLPVIRRLQGEG